MTVAELIGALKQHPESMHVSAVSSEDFETPAFLLVKAQPDSIGFAVVAYGEEVR